MKFLDFLEKWPISLMPLIILLLMPFTVYRQPPATTSTAAPPEYSAAFFLLPTEETLSVSQPLEVSIFLQTGRARVDGADAVLRYNPRMLKAVRLKRGDLFEEYIYENIDETKGEIRLSALTLNPQPKSGTFGTVLFETLKKGTTTVFFEFTPGSSKDSNVALSGSGGVDILKEVKNGSYVIE